MRILVVDNYDSFTFNLVQLVARITGAWPRVVRNDECSVDDLVSWHADAVILSPGPGSPEVAADVGVCRALVDRSPSTPILGVCLGHQVLALAAGGRVVRAPEPMHGRSSSVSHDKKGLFSGLSSPIRVVRYHSLIVDGAHVSREIEVTAQSDDGLIMGVSRRGFPHHGVQFHPESILTEHGASIVGNFLDLARRGTSAGAIRSAASLPPDRTSARLPQPTSEPVSAHPVPKIQRTRSIQYIDPEVAFSGLFRDQRRAFWLDGTGRFSYMGAASECLRAKGHALEVVTANGLERTTGDPFAFLAGRLDDHRRALLQGNMDPVQSTLHRSIPVEKDLLQRSKSELPFELGSGYVGYLGYELSRRTTEGIERASGELPDLLLMRAERVLVFDHEERVLTLCHLGGLDPNDEAEAEHWFDEISARLADAPPLPALDEKTVDRSAIEFRIARGAARYRADVERIRELLRAGESYEVCLTTQARAACEVDAFDLFRTLRRQNPAPYSAYLRFPECAVVSASPERFVHVGRDRVVESRPIKGTRKRGKNQVEDDVARGRLEASEKDRAENLMIVDLVRNDLGRVCEAGSVEVPELMAIEAHPTVFQMVSTVRGRLRGEVSPVEAVRALFPGGSMTGAPKIRSMQIIDALEGAPRGVYSGGIGYFSDDGAVDLAMTIRTLVVTEGEVSFGVGGAVTALSDAADELDEALTKGRALVRAVRSVGKSLRNEKDKMDGYGDDDTLAWDNEQEFIK